MRRRGESPTFRRLLSGWALTGIAPFDEGLFLAGCSAVIGRERKAPVWAAHAQPCGPISDTNAVKFSAILCIDSSGAIASKQSGDPEIIGTLERTMSVHTAPKTFVRVDCCYIARVLG